MKTSDWQSIITPRALIVAENSTPQWKDDIPEYPMYLDYYFYNPPYDLGERSRYSEAKVLLETLTDLTQGACRPEEVSATLLSFDVLLRPPKGKRLLIPSAQAQEGVERIKAILGANPSIEYLFVMGLQTNYYLQKFGLYDCGELTSSFLRGAEPRRVGLSAADPFYQPVDAKPFREICFGRFAVDALGIEVIPILPLKSYPLSGVELTNFGANFESLRESFVR